MRPTGREPMTCGLIDNRATESAANMENYKLYKTNRK